MEKGIQINKKYDDGFMINVYEPDGKVAEAVATFVALEEALQPKNKETVPFVTDPSKEKEDPGEAPNVFCAKCGAKKDKFIPAGVSKAGKQYSGFWACPNGCRK